TLVLHELGYNLFGYKALIIKTDTLFQHQPFTKNTQLVSSRSPVANYSTASLILIGQFNTVQTVFQISIGPADYGDQDSCKRIMKIDSDGNLRLYSLVQHENGMIWETQWQAMSHSCKIHVMGFVSTEFQRCTQNDCDFIQLHNTEFYGHDIQLLRSRTVDSCKKDCLQDNTCMGFQYVWRDDLLGFGCFTKSSLQNGYQMGILYQYGFNGFWYCRGKRSSYKTSKMLQPVATGFRKFTYSELKKASHNFSEEIGRGGACVVYKGKLSDNRIAAIKRLKNTNNQGEADFQAEVADFGLCKLFDRCDSDQWNFSMMRGTRGYIAPEWVFNYPITSKVDVFSYGVVMLEMITGRSPLCMHEANNENCKTEHGLVNWVRDKIHEFDGSLTESWVDKIVDPSISSEYDRSTRENLVKIALQCAKEDREARPSMSQVVGMLIHL
ncbi:apple-like protein, partial [Tanacetum coccineum]